MKLNPWVSFLKYSVLILLFFLIQSVSLAAEADTIIINRFSFSTEEIVPYFHYLKKKNPTFNNYDQCINEYLDKVILFTESHSFINKNDPEIENMVEHAANFIMTANNGPLISYIYDKSLPENIWVEQDSAKVHNQKSVLDFIMRQQKTGILYDSLASSVINRADIIVDDSGYNLLVKNKGMFDSIFADITEYNLNGNTILFSFLIEGNKTEINYNDFFPFYNYLMIKRVLPEARHIKNLIAEYVIQRYFLIMAEDNGLMQDKQFLAEKEFYRRKLITKKFQEKFLVPSDSSISKADIEKYFNEHYKGDTYEDSVCATVITFSNLEIEELKVASDSSTVEKTCKKKLSKKDKTVFTKNDRENNFIYNALLELKDGESSPIKRLDDNTHMRIYKHSSAKKEYTIQELTESIKFMIIGETVEEKTEELIQSYKNKFPEELEKARKVLKEKLTNINI